MKERKVVRCYWAGIFIEEHEIQSQREEEHLMETLQKRLTSKQIRFLQFGVIFILDLLCLDVYEKGALVFMKNLKA